MITFLILYGVRILNSVLVRTYLHPDEYWQSVEPAHLNVYGYGGTTWEWKGEEPIRSPSYHLVFALFYSILKYFKVDNSLIIAYGPRIFIQPFFTAIMDYYIIKLCRVYFGEKYVKIAVIANFTMNLSIIQGIRTYANSIEATFFIIALYYWLKSSNDKIESNKYEILSRIFITLNFLLRGTSLISWPLTFILRLFISKQSLKSKILINFFHAILSLIMAVLIDSLYYKKLVFTAFNFFVWNLFKGFSAHYGTNHFFYFFDYGMPVAVGFWVIFLYYGIYINIKNSLKFPSNKQLLELALILISTLLMLSLSKHKEVRFLLGIYPLFPIYASIGFYSLIEYKWKKISLISIILIFISNYIMVIDHAVFTHFGVIDMMDYIRNLNINNNDKILFLTKCHDFPYYAHIHKNVSLIMPNCDPNVPDTEEYLLYTDSENFVRKYVEKHDPNYIVAYSEFYDKNININEFISEKYQEEKRIVDNWRIIHMLMSFKSNCGRNFNNILFLKKR